ncbi:nucleotidyltransferase domain-containing protein [Paenibacillus zeisoli]|uniref:Nucleotidyltransferase domain-containing protein n=1 Tax=Paenibacillus zeisoli TaxID=2496267 RepID=A0A433XNK7_9BACL|nr:nucleotidyltransferase domain-containing protein [Paenibacillus zeisoli]RUT35660.1 nucleotidyltransferase domain-containing protein [Paenibacillus zeisoli]
MRIQGRAAAEQFIQINFPKCSLAVLGGSGSRSDPNIHSDLDIVIVDDTAEMACHKTIKEYDWIIECFVLTSYSYRDIFNEGIYAANPSLQRMLVEGHVIKCEEEGIHVLEEARTDLAYGPMPWSLNEINFQRYVITDLLEDIRGGESTVELWFSVNRLVVTCCEFHLRVNQQWIGEGKHLFRALKTFDPAMADNLDTALQAVYLRRDLSPIETLVSRTLEPYGGTLLDGFEQ